MSEKQYSYRYYDWQACAGPRSRDEVLTKMQDDHSVIPMERIRTGDGLWTPWADSGDFEGIHGE